MNPIIIYEDADVLVINKPAGLVVHSDGRTVEPSVAEWVLEKYPQTKDVGEPWLSPQGVTIPRPGIVHRLDRTTSGVMIIAKTEEAFLFLKEQFQNRTTEKEYRALVYGHPKTDKGIIEAEIQRVRSTPPRWSAMMRNQPGNKRAAITNWEVLRRAIDPISGEKVSVMRVMPKTGRTHQIRVHLQAIHHPILSDHLYAVGKPQILGLTRPALHAAKLTIQLPSGEKKSFEAPLAPDMVAAEEALREFAENG